MKKIFFFIILLINIYIAFEEECEDQTNKESCLSKTTNHKYPTFCCYLESLFPKNKSINKCKTVPYSSFFSGYKKDYIDDILYNVTCQDKNITTYPLEKCGQKNAKNLNDCKKFSTFVDSCCYYTGTDETIYQKEQCYWLGSKYEGTIKWAGAELKCYNKKLNISLFTKILFILGIFLLF